MLHKSMRKMLYEHNWVDKAKNDSNASQTLRRLRDEAIQAINDLALLAQKLPADTLKDIFNYTNISRLINSLLSETKFDGGKSALDDREKIDLASLMARRGIDFCIKQYGQKIETNSVLNESTIVQLKKSIDICDTIAFKMRIPQIQAVAEKESLIYLFIWNKIEDVHETRVSEITGEDTKKFVNFLDIERGNSPPIGIINKINSDVVFGDRREFEFTDIAGYRGKGSIDLNMKGKVAHLLLEEDGQITAQRDLIVKTEDEDFYVYKSEK